MDNALVHMQVPERRRQLYEHLPDDVLLNTLLLLALGDNVVGKTVAIEQLHHNVHTLAVSEAIEVPDDVWVGQVFKN